VGIRQFAHIVKIWGQELLVKDWYRLEFVSSGEMTISEFGKANQLKSPLLIRKVEREGKRKGGKVA
jgi:DNA-binding transcriptional regulator GbsR (MarR family)